MPWNMIDGIEQYYRNSNNKNIGHRDFVTHPCFHNILNCLMKITTITIISIFVAFLLADRIVVSDVENPDLKQATTATSTFSQTNRTLSIFDSRIVGGNSVKPGEYPYFVQLGGCGGSLIGPNVVLTAGHCGSFFGDDILVSAYEEGEDTYGAVWVKVVAQKWHPQFDEDSLRNDFSLLKLQKSVNFNTGVELTISDDSKNVKNGESLVVLGVGDTDEDGDRSRFLRDVTVQAIATSTCNQKSWYDDDVYDSSMFCAGVPGGGKDSCQGDSGGPIIRRNGNKHVQVGLVSWGEGCARARKPGVYARVSRAHDWIKTVVCDTWKASASFCSGNGGGGTDTGGNCASGKMEFDFTVRTDNYGSETIWFLRNSAKKKILKKRDFESNKIYQVKKCIPKGSYKLVIRDTFGDGISIGGGNPGYRLVVDGNVISESGRINFGKRKKIYFSG